MPFLKIQAEAENCPLRIIAASYCAKQIRKLHVSERKLFYDTLKYSQAISICARLAHRGFIDCDQFLRFLRQSMENVPLDLVWCLHASRVVDITHHLQTFRDDQQHFVDLLFAAVGWENIDRLQSATDLLGALIMHSLLENIWDLQTDIVHTSRKIANEVLDAFFTRYLRFILAVEISDDGKHSTECLNVYKLIRDSRTVTHDVICKFYKMQLTSLLTSSPCVAVAYAIAEQSTWTFNKIPNVVIAIFSELIIPFPVHDVIEIIENILDSGNASWRIFLSFISILQTVSEECGPLLECMISKLLQDAFLSLEADNLFTSFLIVRQLCWDGLNTNFPSYSTWFLNTFGTPSKTLANTKSKLELLLNFLSELVPSEPAKYLRVHILQPPYAGRKTRELVGDYVSLAKTRLQDLQESLDDELGSDVLNFRKPDVERRKVEADVEDAVESYKNIGKLPAFVLEMSIFNVSYFKTSFLRQLLKPRILPEIPDVKMKLIEHLHKMGKIASLVYSEYEKSCHNETLKTVKDEIPANPMDIFRNILSKLENLSKSLENNMQEILHFIGKLHEELIQITDGDRESKSVIMINTDNPVLPLNITVVHLLFNTFCKMLAYGSKSHFTLLPKWCTKLAAAIGNIPSMHCDIYTWIWHAIVFKKMQNMHPFHVDGLSAFLQYMNTLKDCKLPNIKLSTSETKTWDCLDAICAHLPIREKEDMISSLRFIISAINHAIFISDASINRDVPNFPVNLIKKFQFLAMRFLQLQERMKNVFEGAKQLLNSMKVLYKSEIIKSCIEDNLLTFDEWINYECNVDDQSDICNESCRYNYRLWCIENLSWPEYGNSFTHIHCRDILKLIMNK